LPAGGVRRLTLPPGEPEHPRLADAAVTLGEYRFDAQVLDWGSDVLASATPCGLLIIDELGPLEFVRRLGWTRAFDVLALCRYDLAVVVVRPELLVMAAEALHPTPSGVIAVTPGHAELAREELLGLLPDAPSPLARQTRAAGFALR
jgi:hypothetical protein